MRNLWKIFLGIFILVAGVFGYLAWRASTDLVTLNVRNMDVRKVIGKIEWQTWEKIFVGKEVDGKVTLNVRKVPLEDVLEIISDQTESRWNKLYPLYSSSKSYKNLKKVLLGELSAADNGWKALRGGFRFRGGPGGMFGSMNDTQNKLVTLNISMKDIEIATAALSRYSRAQVVPEDGTHDLVSLKLANAPISEGVKQLAKQVKRRWTRLYALESFRRERGPRPDRPPEQFAGGDGSTNRGEFDFESRREFFRTNENFQQRIEAQLETMTPEERAQWEQRRKDFEAMRNMTPEQRREAFQKMASSPGFQERMQSRMMNGIKNTTPEQRVERDIRRNQRASRSGGR
jgi:hypothetical protein